MVRGLRLRRMTDTTGRKVNLIIRRLYCLQCKCFHHELPNCVVPYKRHCADTIQAIISGIKDGLPCESRVIWRILAWWKRVLPYYQCIIKSLAQKYVMDLGGAPSFKEIVRAAANSNNWIFSGLFCTRSVSLSREGA